MTNSNQHLVDPDQIRTYLAMLFEDAEAGYVALRGLGEKGTAQEGSFRELIFLPASAPNILPHARRWADHNVATYIIPAIMHSDSDGRSENVAAFTSVVIDIDSGDTVAKLEKAEGLLGEATMIVHSGGMTGAGTPKLHAYWRLSEPEADTDAVCLLREKLAIVCGGDHQFGVGRAHQPIRVPGTVHAKNGEAKQCAIALYREEAVYHFMDLADALSGVEVPTADPMDFSTAGAGLPPVSDTLLAKVHEGEEGVANRFNSFSQVAGYWLRLAEDDRCSLAEAFDYTMAWMASNMVPPWPLERAQREFNAIWALHQEAAQAKAAIPNLTDGEGLKSWAAARWTQGAPPKRKFLVQGLVPAAVPMIMVAEGGAGKSFLCLDLAMQVGGYAPDTPTTWCGNSLTDECTEASVVMITAEDDQSELHIRLSSLDPEGRRFVAGDRLIILPLINVGGSFPLVQHDRAGMPIPSPKWGALLAELKLIPRLKLVIIDTFNSTLHGEEISAAVVQDWFRVAAGPVCGEMGATLIVTHHIRKGDPVRSIEEMRSAVRGNTAIMNSVRAGLGFWHAHDYRKRMASMGEEPLKGRCYRMGVIKANNPEMEGGVKTLLRRTSGTLEDATRRDRMAPASASHRERKAWLLFAIEEAAKSGHPFTKTGQDGVFERKEALPECLAGVSRNRLREMVEELARDKLLVHASGKRGGGMHKYLDVPHGEFSMGDGEVVAGSFAPPDYEDFYFDADLERVMKNPL